MPSDRVMDIRQRALQLWSLLVLAARTQTVLSYSAVAKMTGLDLRFPAGLAHIAFYCMKRNLPILASLVIGQDTGNPEADFYTGIDVAAEHRRCFVYDWLAHDVPTLEQLEKAFKDREEIKERYRAEKRDSRRGQQ